MKLSQLLPMPLIVGGCAIVAVLVAFGPFGDKVQLAALIIVSFAAFLAIKFERPRSISRIDAIRATYATPEYRRARAAEVLAVVADMGKEDAQRRVAALEDEAIEGKTTEQIIVMATQLPDDSEQESGA